MLYYLWVFIVCSLSLWKWSCANWYEPFKKGAYEREVIFFKISNHASELAYHNTCHLEAIWSLKFYLNSMAVIPDD